MKRNVDHASRFARYLARARWFTFVFFILFVLLFGNLGLAVIAENPNQSMLSIDFAEFLKKWSVIIFLLVSGLFFFNQFLAWLSVLRCPLCNETILRGSNLAMQVSFRRKPFKLHYCKHCGQKVEFFDCSLDRK